MSMKQLHNGDSLGWRVPEGLHELVCRHVKSFYANDSIEIIECHASAKTVNEIHRCGQGCKYYYPLQKDGDICGIVVTIMSSIISLSPIF